MRRTFFCGVMVAVLSAQALAGADDPLVISNGSLPGPAGLMVQRLLEMPSGEQDPQGKKNQERWQLIRDIAARGDAAIPAVTAARKKSSTELQRMELAQVLGNILTPAATKELLALLNDKEDMVRMQAISALEQRVARPAEQGGSEEILPALAKMAPVETVELHRSLILGAMRAVRTPVPPDVKPDEKRVALAVATLRERLKNDESPDIRCAAACYLTEFGDNSGVEEMKKAVLALQAGEKGSFQLEQLVPAIERATGKKFGPVPMNSMLSSDTRKVPGLVADRKALIDTLAAWANEPAATRP